MAYNTELEERIDAIVIELDVGVSKKKMFGGLSYFEQGENMAFAIRNDALIFRASDDTAIELLRHDGLERANMGSRPMRSWLQADGKAITSREELTNYLTIGYQYARNLPPKKQ